MDENAEDQLDKISNTNILVGIGEKESAALNNAKMRWIGHILQRKSPYSFIHSFIFHLLRM